MSENARSPSRADTPTLVAVTATVRQVEGVDRVRLNAAYLRALESVGLIPIVVPPLKDAAAAVRVLDAVAGLLLTGGEDVVWALLRAEGFAVNRKRIERLWRLGGPQGAAAAPPPAARRRSAPPANAAWNLTADRPERRSGPMTSSVARTERRAEPLRILNVVDEYTRLSRSARASARNMGVRHRSSSGSAPSCSSATAGRKRAAF